MSTRAFSESSFMTEPKGYNKAEKGRNGVVTQRGGNRNEGMVGREKATLSTVTMHRCMCAHVH